MSARSKRAQRHDGEQPPEDGKTLQHGYPPLRIESGFQDGQENGLLSEAMEHEIDVTPSATRVTPVREETPGVTGGTVL